jgi:hypothetical protein
VSSSRQDLPSFPGPLTAFRPEEDGPLYLGGDLHAARPQGTDSERSAERDESLDRAHVVVIGHRGKRSETVALGEIWFAPLDEPTAEAGPIFMVYDGKFRLRTWLLLPPAWSLLAEGYLWLPAVPPAYQPTSASRSPGHATRSA